MSNNRREDVKAIEQLRVSRGWMLISKDLRADLDSTRDGLETAAEGNIKELQQRALAIRHLIDLPDKLIEMLEDEHIDKEED